LSVKRHLLTFFVLGSEEEKNWRRGNPQGYKLMKTAATNGSTEIHRAAKEGDTDGLKRALTEKPEFVNAKDINGWTPLLVSHHWRVVLMK
jgi:ankyrin repeat protein